METNYKELYENALKRADSFKSPEIRDITEYIFPELAESEDERIRKALIRYFTLSDEHAYNEACGVSYRDIVAWLERQEQKPADKVEPKFKVGDWIINKEHNNVAKVLEINNEQYRLDYCDTVGTISIALIDNDYHLWTIQDAKDGYVLVCREDKRPFIFKGLLDKLHPEYPVAYCGIAADGIFSVSTGNGWWTDEEVYPSTEEQRDLLFQKMKESGYEWDAEKKELKKIEQKPTAWSEEDKDVLEDIEEAIINYWHGDTQDILLDRLKSLRPQNVWKPTRKQIMALRWVLNHIPYGIHKEEISGLFDQIKDL